jgi:hypothetical protein
MDIEGVLAIALIFGGGTLFLLAISPVGKAVAERIRHAGGANARADARQEVEQLRTDVLGDLEQLRRDVSDLAERVDFAERLLAKGRESGRVAPRDG